VFLSSYRNTSESLGEREILWEHEPQVSVYTAFSKISQRKKENQLVYFDHQNVNSLCSRSGYFLSRNGFKFVSCHILPSFVVQTTSVGGPICEFLSCSFVILWFIAELVFVVGYFFRSFLFSPSFLSSLFHKDLYISPIIWVEMRSWSGTVNEISVTGRKREEFYNMHMNTPACKAERGLFFWQHRFNNITVCGTILFLWISSRSTGLKFLMWTDKENRSEPNRLPSLRIVIRCLFCFWWVPRLLVWNVSPLTVCLISIER